MLLLLLPFKVEMRKRTSYSSYWLSEEARKITVMFCFEQLFFLIHSMVSTCKMKTPENKQCLCRVQHNITERWIFFFSFILASIFELTEPLRYVTLLEINRTAWLAITGAPTQSHWNCFSSCYFKAILQLGSAKCGAIELVGQGNRVMRQMVCCLHLCSFSRLSHLRLPHLVQALAIKEISAWKTFFFYTVIFSMCGLWVYTHKLQRLQTFRQLQLLAAPYKKNWRPVCC